VRLPMTPHPKQGPMLTFSQSEPVLT